MCLWSLKRGDGSQYKTLHFVGLYILVTPFHSLCDQPTTVSLVIKGDFLNEGVASTSVPHHMCVAIVSVIKKIDESWSYEGTVWIMWLL